jgi:Leucine-rich repeat (LRR) protein
VYYYYYEQLSIKEIAGLLAVSENTVSSRLRLARDKIRVELENHEDEEGLKLYMASPLILIPLLGMLSQNTDVPANLLAQITSQLNLSASAASASTTTTATSTTAATSTATTATGVISVKTIIAAVVCCVVVTCGIVAGVLVFGGDDSVPSGRGDEPRVTREGTGNLEDVPMVSLSGQGITDEMLAAMVADGTIPANVTQLSLLDNLITDTSPLSGLINLTYLDLQQNQIIDTSPLGGLTNLTNLRIGVNSITDVKPY